MIDGCQHGDEASTDAAVTPGVGQAVELVRMFRELDVAEQEQVMDFVRHLLTVDGADGR